jgi:hypothetical protein
VADHDAARPREIPEQLGSAVGGAVVHEDDLARDPLGQRRGLDPGDDLADRRLLVVDRDDDRQLFQWRLREPFSAILSE